MDYFYDIALEQFVDASGSTRPIRKLAFMRDEDTVMEIQLQSNGAAYTPNGTALLTFAIKQAPGESSTTLAIIESGDFAESGGTYTGTLDLNGEDLSDLLGSDFSLTLYAQLSITDDDGTIKSRVIPVVMSNDIIRGDEVLGNMLPDPDAYVRARAVVYDAAQTLTTGEKSQARSNIDSAIKTEVKFASFTAVDGGDYVVVATATVTDPTPSEGARFTVLVRNGTATVGGTGYSTAGTIIERIYHSGAWASYVNSGTNTGDQDLTSLTSFLNVKASPYNAVGDGVTDDTAAIQAALDAAGDTVATRTVYLPAGTYKLTATLVLKNAGTHVCGDSITSTILNQTTAAAHVFAWDDYTGTGGNAPQECRIRDMKLVGLGYATHTGSGIFMRRNNGTYITGVASIERVRIDGFANGIYTRQFWRLLVSGCYFGNNTNGLWLDQNDTFKISNCSIGASSVPSGTIGFKLTGNNFGGVIENGEYGDLDSFMTTETGVRVTVIEPNIERCGDADGQAAVTISGGQTRVVWCGGRIENGVGNSTRAIFRCVSTVALGVPTLSFLNVSNFGAGGARTIEINGDNRVAMQVTSQQGRYDITTSLTAGGTADVATLYYTPTISANNVNGIAATQAGRGQIGFVPGTTDVPDHFLTTRKIPAGTFKRVNLFNDALINVLSDTATVATNTSTGATTLYTYTLPTNTINATKQAIRVTAFGKFAANANNKRIQADWGNGIAIFDSGTLAINDNDWSLDIIIIYTASGNYSARVLSQCDDALWGNKIQVTKTINRFSNQANIINIIGTGGATADIELLYAKTEWMKNDSEY